MANLLQMREPSQRTALLEALCPTCAFAAEPQTTPHCHKQIQMLKKYTWKLIYCGVALCMVLIICKQSFLCDLQFVSFFCFFRNTFVFIHHFPLFFCRFWGLNWQSACPLLIFWHMSRLCYWIHDTSTLSILFKGLEITVIGFIFALCGLHPLLVVGGTRSSISICLHISVYSIPCRNWIKCNDLLETVVDISQGEFP